MKVIKVNGYYVRKYCEDCELYEDAPPMVKVCRECGSDKVTIENQKYKYKCSKCDILYLITDQVIPNKRVKNCIQCGETLHVPE